MSGEHEDRLRVEAWEMEMAAGIAGSFRPGDEDFKSELFRRLVEIKGKKFDAVRDWRAFLARSLYNAAKNVIRYEEALCRKAKMLRLGDEPDGDLSFDPARVLMAPEESVEALLCLSAVWVSLTPEMRELAQLLVEEQGNTAALAKRLGRPRKTVEYWIRKLRTALHEHGFP